MKITLKLDAPAGDFKHALQLRTNDLTARVIPVLVEGTIRAPLTVTPNPVYFGTVRGKQQATRRLTVRGDRPFQIMKVEGLPAGMTALTPDTAGTVQPVTLTWAPQTIGDLNAQLTVHTDLSERGTITVSVQGQAGGQ